MAEAPTTDAVATTATMYDRVGGAPALRVVVERFYGFIDEDPEVRRFFEGVDMPRQRRHLATLLGQVLGGPKEYNGRSLAEAHAGLGIEDRHYDLVGDYLTASLLVAHVPKDIVEAVQGVLEGSRAQVVSAPASDATDGTD